MKTEIESIRKMLWSDQSANALVAAKSLLERVPGDPEIQKLVKDCMEWLSHTVSEDAYAAFYRAHRRSFVPADSMPMAHEQFPRLGVIRQWMLERPPKTILDLGCFDGFALINLCDGTGAFGIGVDLDEDALKHAADSANQLGREMRWIHSMAERIDLDLKVDAVLIMELLEHVIDPVVVLKVAEKHLAPGGRIYITTPGTPVPHFDNEKEAKEHLRCITEAELLNMIGDVVVDAHTQLQPAHHKERVLCYRRPKTTFVVNHIAGGWNPANAETYRGSEEAVVLLADALGRKGHEVQVFYNDARPDNPAFPGMNNVQYRPHEEYDATQHTDILIIKKTPQMLDLALNARLVFYWTTDPNGPNDFLPARVDKITQIIPLTEWHKKELIALNPDVNPDLFQVVPYGIPAAMNREKIPIKRNPARMVYASSYDRGLEWLLDHWKEIKEQVADAELHVWYGWRMFDQITQGNPEGQMWKATMQEKMKQDGVIERGETSPFDMQPFLEAAVWAYPCTGGERFCITGKKAQRLGAIPVIVPTMALDETVTVGIKTDHEKYVHSLTEMLRNPEVQEGLRTRIQSGLADVLDWDEVYWLWRRLWFQTLLHPPVETRRRLSEKRETITAAFITLNAESLFLRALKSVKDIADEIIVVDCGSTDDTIQMAERFGAKIHTDKGVHFCLACNEQKDGQHFVETEHEPYGFEGPRNTCVALAESDWILWLDSDEEFLTAGTIKKYLRPNCYNGYAIRQHHFSVQPPNAFKADLPVRIFRNGIGARQPLSPGQCVLP